MEVYVHDVSTGVSEVFEIDENETTGVLKLRIAEFFGYAAVEEAGEVVLSLDSGCVVALPGEDEETLCSTSTLSYGTEIFFKVCNLALLRAVREGDTHLSDCTEDERNDPDVVSAALSHSSFALSQAGKSIRADKAFILSILPHHPEAFHYVSTELKNDADVVISAVRQNSAFFEFAGKTAKANRSIVLQVVRDNPMYFEVISDALKRDPDVAIEALKGDSRVVTVLPKVLFANKEVMMGLLAWNGKWLEQVRGGLQGDKEVVMLALQTYQRAIDYASEDLRENDRDCRIAAGLPVRRLRDADDPHLADKDAISAKTVPKKRNPQNIPRVEEETKEDTKKTKGGSKKVKENNQKKQKKRK